MFSLGNPLVPFVQPKVDAVLAIPLLDSVRRYAKDDGSLTWCKHFAGNANLVFRPLIALLRRSRRPLAIGLTLISDALCTFSAPITEIIILSIESHISRARAGIFNVAFKPGLAVFAKPPSVADGYPPEPITFKPRTILVMAPIDHGSIGFVCGSSAHAMLEMHFLLQASATKGRSVSEVVCRRRHIPAAVTSAEPHGLARSAILRTLYDDKPAESMARPVYEFRVISAILVRHGQILSIWLRKARSFAATGPSFWPISTEKPSTMRLSRLAMEAA